MPQLNLSNARVVDPVITQVVHGYCQADSIADFVAPVVPVDVRAGKVIKFGKEQFTVSDTRRSPGTRIERVSTTYGYEDFLLQQHARAGVITEEEYQEAMYGEAKIDLRVNAAKRAAAEIAQSWEAEVINSITNPSVYETSNTAALSGVAQFSDPGSDPERTVQSWKEAVRAQIGCYPNAAIISTDVYNALKFHPIFRDRVKYTSDASVNLAMLATWFDLTGGIRVAQRVKLNPATDKLTDMMPRGTFLTFYKGDAEMVKQAGLNAVFMPLNEADKAKPSFAYTYSLRGYPVATKERFDEDYRIYLTEVLVEQKIVLTGLGDTGKVGGGFLAQSVVA